MVNSIVFIGAPMRTKVFPEKSYDVLLIGKFSEKTLPFRSQRINLIERNTKYGNRPNHYAIIIVET